MAMFTIISIISALIHQAIQDNIKKIRLHILLVVRDIEGRSALYIKKIETIIAQYQTQHIDIAIASGGIQC